MPKGSSTIHPITHEVAVSLAHAPDGVERSLWLYELCRFLTMKVNNLIIAFFAEDPPCSQQSCPEMRASEWQYLCAVHDPPKSCCAIDYCCHTLDWATNILTSPKYFPSRLTLGSESGGGPHASMRHLTNIFRRLYRIFAHAWFQHRDVFRQVENTDGLYIFFKTVCDVYELIPQDNYTVPQEAEHLAASDDAPDTSRADFSPATALPIENNRRISVLRNDSSSTMQALSLDNTAEGLNSLNTSTGATTRRHKHSPSIGSSVSTIKEVTEDPNTPSANTEQLLPKVEENGEDSAENTASAVKDTETPSSNAGIDAAQVPVESEQNQAVPESSLPNTESIQDSEQAEISNKAVQNEDDAAPSTEAVESHPPDTEEEEPKSERAPSNGQLETDFKFPPAANEVPSDFATSFDPSASRDTSTTVSVVETTDEQDD